MTEFEFEFRWRPSVSNTSIGELVKLYSLSRRSCNLFQYHHDPNSNNSSNNRLWWTQLSKPHGSCLNIRFNPTEGFRIWLTTPLLPVSSEGTACWMALSTSNWIWSESNLRLICTSCFWNDSACLRPQSNGWNDQLSQFNLTCPNTRTHTQRRVNNININGAPRPGSPWK